MPYWDAELAKMTEDEPMLQRTTASNFISQHKLILPLSTGNPLSAVRTDESVYKARLSAMQTIIPMDYTPLVGNFINVYVSERRLQVRDILARTNVYFPTIEAALDRHNLPYELKFLPVVLSALLPAAKSESTGAAGLWQLPYQVGMRYGLAADDFIDERRDPLLSSEAAAQHLKHLYNRYRNWHLAVAAFCAGESTVNKAVQRSGSRNYWDVAAFLPLEAQAYVPLFIAGAYVMTYYPDHNLYKSDPIYTFYLTDTVRVPINIDIHAVANHLDVAADDLKFINPALKTNLIPGRVRSYPLVVPISKTGVMASYLESLMAGTTDRFVLPTPTALPLPKDNPLNQDLDAYGKPYQEVNDPEVREINSPSTTITTPAAAPKPAKKPAATVQKYKVKEGDNLWDIAQKYGVTDAAIKNHNRLKSDVLYPGMVLFIPVSPR